MKWDDFLPRVLSSVAGCPRDLALQHTVDAARVFASRTGVWNYQATPILTQAGIDTYTLQLGVGQELAKLLLCEVDGTPYSIVRGTLGRAMARRGCGSLCIPTGPHDFQLAPVPTQDGLTILTDIAVRPSLANPDKWPDDLDENVTDIVHGALSTLLDMPTQGGVTWGNKDKAATEAALFRDRISTVRIKVENAYGKRLRPAASRYY